MWALCRLVEGREGAAQDKWRTPATAECKALWLLSWLGAGWRSEINYCMFLFHIFSFVINKSSWKHQGHRLRYHNQNPFTKFWPNPFILSLTPYRTWPFAICLKSRADFFEIITGTLLTNVCKLLWFFMVMYLLFNWVYS